MRILRFDITQSQMFFGVLDTPGELTKVSENFEVRGWICAVGSPAVVKIRTSQGTTKARHTVRRDVNRHVSELRSKAPSDLYVYAFCAKVIDLDAFELIVENANESVTWIRATNVWQEFERSFHDASAFFSDTDFLSHLRWTEDAGAHFEVNSNPKYFILGSVEIGDANFILLRDGDLNAHFVLAQRVIASELLTQVQSEESAILHKDFTHVDQKLRDNSSLLVTRIKEHISELPSTNQEKPVFGIGKLSPHHYFYETLPGLLAMSLKLHPSIPKILVNCDREFFDTKLLLEGFWVARQDHSRDGDFFSFSHSPMFLGGHNLFQIGADEREKLDRTIVFHSGAGRRENIETHTPTIWFDTSTLNRSWNMEEVFSGLMEELLSLYDKPTFVLDGLTARWHDLHVPTIPDWVATVPDIQRARIIPLNLARADEKICRAFHVDFFFASFTTGSMFVHRFASAPGIAMSAPRTYEHPRLYVHGDWRKITIPPQLFKSQDLDGDPAWASFQLDKEAFIPWAIAQALKFLPPPTKIAV